MGCKRSTGRTPEHETWPHLHLSFHERCFHRCEMLPAEMCSQQDAPWAGPIRFPLFAQLLAAPRRSAACCFVNADGFQKSPSELGDEEFKIYKPTCQWSVFYSLTPCLAPPTTELRSGAKIPKFGALFSHFPSIPIQGLLHGISSMLCTNLYYPRAWVQAGFW